VFARSGVEEERGDRLEIDVSPKETGLNVLCMEEANLNFILEEEKNVSLGGEEKG